MPPSSKSLACLSPPPPSYNSRHARAEIPHRSMRPRGHRKTFQRVPCTSLTPFSLQTVYTFEPILSADCTNRFPLGAANPLQDQSEPIRNPPFVLVLAAPRILLKSSRLDSCVVGKCNGPIQTRPNCCLRNPLPTWLGLMISTDWGHTTPLARMWFAVVWTRPHRARYGTIQMEASNKQRKPRLISPRLHDDIEGGAEKLYPIRERQFARKRYSDQHPPRL
jgi:hypothetical protein